MAPVKQTNPPSRRTDRTPLIAVCPVRPAFLNEDRGTWTCGTIPPACPACPVCPFGEKTSGPCRCEARAPASELSGTSLQLRSGEAGRAGSDVKPNRFLRRGSPWAWDSGPSSGGARRGALCLSRPRAQSEISASRRHATSLERLANSKYRPCPLLVKYVEAGWLGRKTQRGFYDYRGEQPVPTR